ncbi:MAG: zinc ribbon domain-containing protein [Thiohalocapsa sp.]|jgi:putative FmdB family regulatory protein|uniref:FmdB family zinc ribbon protein n=1 Tax=Thiohalocapsa sp. TaxID=2497641 RepID=UPI0026008BC6|nr:FmdB family zinc ribbon protein [Thiohalocapsa sp.]MCG6940803.1 zinc ribbon domain-containing protein [Thiohalocapsa sp.]
MPIYAYRCEACGHELDALQKLSDAPLTDCPACGEAALKKQLTAAAFRLKGGGWYETDFKKDGKKNLHQTDDKPKEKVAAADKGGDKSKEAGQAAGAPKPGGDKPSAAKPASEAKPSAPKAAAPG